jgi:hypothetical protein
LESKRKGTEVSISPISSTKKIMILGFGEVWENKVGIANK